MDWRASWREDQTLTGETMENSWRKLNSKQGKSPISIEPLGYDRDKETFVAPPSVPSQRRKCDSNEVKQVSLTSMNMRLAERSSHDLIRSQGCTDTLDTLVSLLCKYNNCHDSEEGPRIPHKCVSGRNGSDRLQDGTTSEEFNRPVGSRSQDGHERERIVQTARINQYMEKANLQTQTVPFFNVSHAPSMCHGHVTALDTDILSKSTEAPNAEIDIVQHCANTGNFDSANPVPQHLYKDASALSLLSAFIALCCAHYGMIYVFICQGSFLMAIYGFSPQIMTLMNLNGHQLHKAKVKLKLQLTGMGFQKNVKPVSAYSTSFHEERENRIMQAHRYQGVLTPAFQIVSKDQKNKDILEVESLFEKCDLLIKKVVDQNTQELTADRRYKEAYAVVRESYGNIRRNVERWRDTVLHSAVSWFKEGAYNSNVRKLMSRGLARFGKGGNGELVEAFQSGERLVIKQTLLRESEWSIVTLMDHPNVMPWLALVCGDRSDTKPGQIVSYQVMPKMTEDLSAAIRKMGGSIHHYILQLQEAEEPNSVLSAKADLVRQRSAEILRGTLQGLDYMHRQNLVHRDIKASNILLKRPVDCPHEAVHTCTCQERWEVKVADFDSVIHLSVARDRAQRRKQLKVGNTGTSGYRAPEVFFESCTSDINAKDYYSPASDIWSFGAVCLHLAMGFCCPRHQYQVGLIMLARHNLVNIPAEEAQEKVDRTVGMYHIRQGFNGEKWQNMINFTARPLEVDWSKRPSAETLLKDQFVKPATTLHSSQTGAKNMNERLNRPQTHRPPTSPPNDESSKESGHIPVQPPSGTEAAAVSDASPSKKTLQGLQKPLQSSANAKEEGVQEAKNPSTPPLTSDESVLGGRRCSSISEDQRQEGHGNHDRDAGRQGVGRGSSSQTPECSSSGNIKSSSSPEDNRCTSSVEVEEAGDKPSLLEPHQADRMYDKIGQALPAETYQVVASPTIQTLLAQSTYQTVQVLALQAFQELHSTESKTVESDDIGVVRLQKGDRRSSAESSVSSTCTYVSDQSTPPPELHQPIPPQQNDCVEVPAVCHLSSHHSTSEGEQLVEQEEATNGGMPGGVLVAGSTPLVQCTAGFTELVVSSSSSSARYRNVVGLPTVCTVCKIKEHYKHDSDDEDSEKKKKKAMD